MKISDIALGDTFYYVERYYIQDLTRQPRVRNIDGAIWKEVLPKALAYRWVKMKLIRTTLYACYDTWDKSVLPGSLPDLMPTEDEYTLESLECSDDSKPPVYLTLYDDGQECDILTNGCVLFLTETEAAEYVALQSKA